MPTSKTNETPPTSRCVADHRARQQLRRQAKQMAEHPENDAVDAWIEVAYDWSEWR